MQLPSVALFLPSTTQKNHKGNMERTLTEKYSVTLCLKLWGPCRSQTCGAPASVQSSLCLIAWMDSQDRERKSKSWMNLACHSHYLVGERGVTSTETLEYCLQLFGILCVDCFCLAFQQFLIFYDVHFIYKLLYNTDMLLFLENRY